MKHSKEPTGWVVVRHSESMAKPDLVLTKRPVPKQTAEAMAERYNRLDSQGRRHRIYEVGPNAPYELMDGKGVAGLYLYVRPRTGGSLGCVCGRSK